MSIKYNIKLKIAYDGSRYLGWQKTKIGPSIESELEKALTQILQENITLQAASRTDAGVHAVGQIVNFFSKKSFPEIGKLKIKLNCLLPKDIVVIDAEIAHDSFHPTLDCVGKEYHYSLCYGQTQLPQYRHFSWHYPRYLDINSMQSALHLIIGERDFGAFCNFKKNSNYKNYIRNVQDIRIIEEEKCRLCFHIKGDHFLYKMVRNIIGTLVYIGCGKIEFNNLSSILESGNRARAGMTAPAHGLSLYRVYYSSYANHFA